MKTKKLCQQALAERNNEAMNSQMKSNTIISGAQLGSGALLACPWCRTNKHLRVLKDIWNGKDYGFAVCCKDACCCGPVRMTEAAAVKAWQRTAMNEPITAKVTAIVGGGLCVSSEDGQKVHDKIVPLLREGRPVALSFEGVDTLISAFLNAAIGQLYGEFSEEQIRQLLSVKDMTPEDLGILKRVVENAKRYFANKPAFDAAWKEVVGNDEEE